MDDSRALFDGGCSLVGLSRSPNFVELLYGRGIAPILLLGILILVFVLSRNIMRMSGGAVGVFFSVLNGLLCSSVFISICEACDFSGLCGFRRHVCGYEFLGAYY